MHRRAVRDLGELRDRGEHQPVIAVPAVRRAPVQPVVAGLPQPVVPLRRHVRHGQRDVALYHVLCEPQTTSDEEKATQTCSRTFMT